MRALLIYAPAILLLLTCPCPGVPADAPDLWQEETARITQQLKATLEPLVARYPFQWEQPRAGPHNIPFVYRTLGELYILEGRDLSRGCLLRGQGEALSGDMTAARKHFEFGLTRAPSADLAYGVGWSMMRECGTVTSCSREHIESAISYFDRAIELEPAHCLALHHVASCHYWLAASTPPHERRGAGAPVWSSHVNAALSAWQRYLAHCPPSTGIYYKMGELYHSQGNLAKQAHCWEVAIGMGGEYPFPDHVVSLYEHQLDDPEYAARMLRLAIGCQEDPERAARFKGRLADFCLRHGRHNEAIKLFRERAEQAPSGVSFYELGRAVETLGDPAEALAWYRHAEEQPPSYIAQDIREAIERVSSQLRERETQ
jgi:tetratricopeptide (TPR) repeat protein